jgi:hypothetical protein
MKPMIFAITTLVLASPAFAGWGTPATELTVPADKLSVDCRGYDGNILFVLSGESVVYQTSKYGSIASCSEDQKKIDVLFSAARATGNKIKFKSTDSPLNDFSIALSPRSKLSTSPKNLTADCRGYNGNILFVFSGEKVVYRTTQYGSAASCNGDANKLQVLFNSAKAFGKMVNFSLNDSPIRDFNISDESDPAGPQSFRNEELKEENSDQASTAA